MPFPLRWLARRSLRFLHALGAILGCSWGFMLPVSTPPNAIVYGSGLVPIIKMIRAGLLFDLAGGLVIWVALRLLLPLIGLA